MSKDLKYHDEKFGGVAVHSCDRRLEGAPASMSVANRGRPRGGPAAELPHRFAHLEACGGAHFKRIQAAPTAVVVIIILAKTAVIDITAEGVPVVVVHNQ